MILIWRILPGSLWRFFMRIIDLTWALLWVATRGIKNVKPNFFQSVSLPQSKWSRGDQREDTTSWGRTRDDIKIFIVYTEAVTSPSDGRLATRVAPFSRGMAEQFEDDDNDDIGLSVAISLELFIRFEPTGRISLSDQVWDHTRCVASVYIISTYVQVNIILWQYSPFDYTVLY